MEVLCIQESDGMALGNSGRWCDHRGDSIKFGEKYNVIKIVDSHKYKGSKSYVLAEFDQKRSFNEKYFAPISNIDERDLVREEYKEKVL